MWSRTKKALEGRSACSLKGHIQYRFERYPDYWGAFFILVDGKTWFTTDVTFSHEYWKRQGRLMKERDTGDYWKDFYATKEQAELLTIRETGFVSTELAMKYVHEYLNVYSIQECLSGENCFLFMLAMLDRRTGKRRVKRIYKNVEAYSEWLQKFILFRAAAEGIIYKEEQQI